MLSHFTGAEENLSKSTTHLPVSKPASQASPKRLPEYERARWVWNVEWNIFFPLRFNSRGEFAEKKEKLQYFSFLSQSYDVTRNAKWYGGHFSSLLLTWFENLRLAVTDRSSTTSNSCHYLLCWELITHIFKQFLASLICYWFNFVLKKIVFAAQESGTRTWTAAIWYQAASLSSSSTMCSTWPTLSEYFQVAKYVVHTLC